MSRYSAWPLWPIVSLAVAVCHGEPPVVADRVPISGRVLDEHSLGVAAVKVRGIAYTDITEATTDDNGCFTLNVIEERVRQLAIIADDADTGRLGTYKAERDDPPSAESFIEISLMPCKSLPVVVSDANGNPAPGVRVGALINYAALTSVVTDAAGKAVLRLPTDAEIQSLYAVKHGIGFDYRIVSTPRDEAYQAEWLDEHPVRFRLAGPQTVQIRLVDADENPITETEVYLWLLHKPGEPSSFNLSFTPTEFRAVTNDKGVAEFRGVPDWSLHPLTFWPNNKQFVHDRITFDRKQHPDGRLTVKLDRLVRVTGHVRFADGRPAADINVHVDGTGYKMDGFREVATTDADGRFDVRVTPNLLYMLAVQDERWAAPAIDGLVVRPDKPVEGLEFELRTATRVHGQVTVGPDEKPIVGQQMSLRQEGRDLHQLEGVELPNPDGSRRWVQPGVSHWTMTDEEGQYEFFVGPGKFRLSGPSQLKSEQFEVVDEPELVFNFAAPRPEKGPFTGQVVAGDPPRPVPGAVIDGKYRAFVGRDLRLRADEQGRFAGERYLHKVVLCAMSEDGTLGGIVEIEPDQTEAIISIGPLASARARLVDAVTGEPLPSTKVQWGRRVHKGDDNGPWETAWGGTLTTDSSGQFEIRGLVVGQEYSLSVPRGDGTYGSLPGLTAETSDSISLGDLRLERPYKPPTFAERVDRELAADRPAGERFDRALEEAKRLRQHVLIVVLDRDAALTESWFNLRFDDRPVRGRLPDYQLIQVEVESKGAASLADRIGVTIDKDGLPLWWFGDAAGEELRKGQVPHLAEGDGLDRAALLESLSRHAPEPLDARELLTGALVEAATSNRRVIVQETATWCGPCHMLARYLERHRSIWEKDYLWVRIDQRWHGSEEVMNGIKEGYRGGIPWFAILDSDGTVLATSEGPDGNIGFPSKPASIDHFLTMLRSTKQRISEQELAALREGLASQ